MIQEETVFILGAGASKPYGYPTAKELKKYICTYYPASEKGALAKALVSQFSKAPTESIDLHLSRNQQYHKIGKQIIVQAIAYFEETSPDEMESPDLDWYSYVFNEMTNEVRDKKEIDSFFDNKISFITFNYDRSLEEFFINSFQNAFVGLEDSKLKELLSHIKIHHVYGLYQPPSWQRGSAYKKYDEYCNWESMTSNIRTINEERESSKMHGEKIQEWIVEAKRIFFLGFGYSPENLEILNLSQIIDENHHVFGTALGASQEVIDKIKLRLDPTEGIKKFGPPRMFIQNTDCRDLLEKYL